MLITYPSVQFPAPPGVSLALPDDWEAKYRPDVLLCAMKTVPDGEFSPNVIVRTNRMIEWTRTEQAVDSIDTGIDSLREVQDIGREFVDISGLSGYRREYVYRHESGGALAQAIRAVVVPNTRGADLVEVIGTVSADASKQQLPELREVMESLRLER